MQPSFESVQRAEHESLTVQSYRSSQFPFAWHLHPELELTLIVDGRGQRYVGDSMEEFAPGDLVLLGGNLPHTWHTPAPAKDSSAAVVVHIPPSAIPTQPELNAVSRLLAQSDRGLAFPLRVAGEVTDAMAALVRQPPLDRWLSVLAILGRLARVRGVRTLSSRPFDRSIARNDRKAIDRVCRWVADRIDQPIRQTEAAALIHRSPATFARFFKRMMGQTFIEYLVQLRVGRACRMLAETDLPITTICFRAGFNNVSYFNRAFRRHRGTTPRAYREAFSSA